MKKYQYRMSKDNGSWTDWKDCHSEDTANMCKLMSGWNGINYEVREVAYCIGSVEAKFKFNTITALKVNDENLETILSSLPKRSVRSYGIYPISIEWYDGKNLINVNENDWMIITDGDPVLMSEKSFNLLFGILGL